MDNSAFQISGQIIDVINSRIFKGTIFADNGKIINIIEDDNDNNQIIMPGFVDSHIHIESSLLVPTEFARLAVVHGTVATVSDPHEIANVLGINGVRYMIETGKKSPMKFYFGAPSCVPATSFETSGAVLDSNAVDELLSSDEIKYLGEMMNYPGVIFDDDEVVKKIELAKLHNKQIDGHAPLLSGNDLVKYCKSGITTDHECSNLQEAREKAALGMTIQIREGSAAKNFDALIPLIDEAPEKIMFCSDDLHPHELINGHINRLVKKAISLGYNILDIIKAATLAPIRHYNLEVGLLQKNDPADFIIIDNFIDFNVLKTYINGKLVAENNKSLIPEIEVDTINNFKTGKVDINDFNIYDKGRNIKIINVLSGELLTEKLIGRPQSVDKNLVSDVENDILKIAVINRYEKKKISLGFIKNFGLKKGALASSVAHDSHNIVVIGCSDEEMTEAANMIINTKGGLAAWSRDKNICIPLPIAGLMTNEDGHKVAADYQALVSLSKELGSTLNDPFMTMGFMSLLVIPKLKLSDKGLFDCEKFELTTLFVDLRN
ncbi:MAG: adenine deaminase [Bacteroidales bacterium]|nr:adenine deaminase [Bacteroidales bacterium]